MFSKWSHSLIKFICRKSPLEIYTDGSFKEGRGAWAYVVVQNGTVLREASGKTKKSSSNRMEFQAVIEALKSLSEKSTAVIKTDSRIVVDTMTIWAQQWESLDWQKQNGREIPNVDLIKELYELNQKHFITWKWIRAHAGIEFNERCDELCIQARGS